MTESILWVGGVVVAALVLLSRFARDRAPIDRKPPQAPPEPVGATHARDAIESALQTETDAIERAKTGDDPAGDLAALANRANEARQ